MADGKITATAHVNLSGFGLAAGETGEIDDTAEVRVAEQMGMVTVHDTGQTAPPEPPAETAETAETAPDAGEPEAKAEKPARAHRASKAAHTAESTPPAAE